MINLISITTDKYEIDNATKKYVMRKVGRLDRYLPRHARKTAHADVILREVNRSHGNKYEAEIIIKLPGKVVTAKDSTVNMLAAIDIVEAKLATQLHKYKSVNTDHNRKLTIVNRLRRFREGDVA